MKLFQKTKSSEYVYENNKLVIKGKSSREIKSVIQFGVCATSYCLDINKKLISATLKQEIPIIYISDNILNEKYVLESYIPKEYQQKIHYKYLNDLDVNNELIENKIMEKDLFNLLEKKESIFLIPKDNIIEFNKKYLEQFKKNFLIQLEQILQCEIKKQVLVIINISTLNFSEKELNRIHTIIRELKKKNFICVTNLSDYGSILNFQDNFMGESGDYDEYWIWNYGEGREIYPYIKNIENMPFFKKLPKVLIENFSKTSFMSESNKYFKNGIIKKSGCIIFSDKNWFFEIN